uniref:G-protein coupled receptors family 1 profile domain-containing protein n=1 Tax=Romanomermis culicivorax TaxID=13658 RepID=A0A915IIN1_ROMCU
MTKKTGGFGTAGLDETSVLWLKVREPQYLANFSGNILLNKQRLPARVMYNLANDNGSKDQSEVIIIVSNIFFGIIGSGFNIFLIIILIRGFNRRESYEYVIFAMTTTDLLATMNLLFLQSYTIANFNRLLCSLAVNVFYNTTLLLLYDVFGLENQGICVFNEVDESYCFIPTCLLVCQNQWNGDNFTATSRICLLLFIKFDHKLVIVATFEVFHELGALHVFDADQFTMRQASSAFHGKIHRNAAVTVTKIGQKSASPMALLAQCVKAFRPQPQGPSLGGSYLIKIIFHSVTSVLQYCCLRP